MTTLQKPKIEAFTLEIPSLSRHAIDELYHFLQYLQFKHHVRPRTPLSKPSKMKLTSLMPRLLVQEPGETYSTGKNLRRS